MSRVHVLVVTVGQYQPLTRTQRKEHELLNLLEAPRLTAKKMARLEHLLQEFSRHPRKLQKLLSKPTPAECGFMTVPRSCAIRQGRLTTNDSISLNSRLSPGFRES